MTQRTRYFLLGSALVVVLGVGTGLVAYYNGAIPGLSSADDAELAYVPADSTALAYADVRAIMASDFRQKLREALPTGDEKDRIHKEIGVDLEHDIDVVVAGFRGSDPSNGGAVVLVRGRFNDAKIETTAVQHGARAEEYKGKRMLVWNHGTQTAEPVEGSEAAGAHAVASRLHGPVVAFLEPGLLALGDTTSVRSAIDAAVAKNAITQNAELMKLVNDVRDGANAWVVGRFEEFTKNAKLPDEVKSRLPAVQFLAVSAHVNGGLTGTLRAQTRDEQAAQDLKAVVSGALAAGRLMAGQDERATTVLNALQVGGTNKTVTLGFSLPPNVLDVLSGIARSHMHDGPERKPTPR
jgi:hypothetical protein